MKKANYAIKVDGLTVHYDTAPVLWDINVEVPRGTLVGILGPNGAGKSTFIKALLGLVTPVSGTVFLLGHHLNKVRNRIAYVPQREAVDWDFPITVKELVLMGRYPQLGLWKWVRKKDLEMVDECLELVGMQEYKERQISQLSGGQQQRAFLARALIQEADMYFLDEPLAGVDHVSEEIIMNILWKMKQDQKTIFMVHHDLGNVKRYFDWIVLLNIRLVASGNTADVFTKSYIEEAYGRNFSLYDETAKLSKEKIAGLA